MPTPFKHYLIKNALRLAAFNAAMNAAYTAYAWQGQELLALYDGRAVALDLANTPAVIALLSTLMGTAAARKKLSDGRIDVSNAQAPGMLPGMLDLLPQGIAMRALLLAFTAIVLLALPLWFALSFSGTAAMPVEHAVGLKVLITIVMTLVIVPLVDLAALSDVQHLRNRRFAV
jgi:hypothetical protein